MSGSKMSLPADYAAEELRNEGGSIGRRRQDFLISMKIFSNLMELRNGSVGGHARRVAELAQGLATHMGLGPGVRKEVFIAGLLHDIGKTGFSDALFTTPVSKMTEKELELYRKHSMDGADALMPLSELHEVARIVLSHHEHFDGSGFPDGLDRAGIPLGARILAVANDYDALQTGAILEKRLTAREAGEMIAHWRDKRYDPHVVDAFLELLAHPPGERADEMDVSVRGLEAGMVLARDLVSVNGRLLLTADYRVDESVIGSLRKYAAGERTELVLRIRKTRLQEKGTAPIPASNSNGFEENGERPMRDGMNDFIAKPVEAAQSPEKVILSPPLRKDVTQSPEDPGQAMRPDVARIDAAGMLPLLGTIHGLDVSAFPRMLDSDLPTYLELLELFVEKHHYDAALLAASVAAGDYEAVRCTAHALKGVAGNLGAWRVAHLALEVAREAGDNTNLNHLQDYMEMLASELAFLVGRLRDVLLAAAEAEKETALSWPRVNDNLDRPESLLATDSTSDNGAERQGQTAWQADPGLRV